jgi:transcriptional regulator with XRE-family HTH domain
MPRLLINKKVSQKRDAGPKKVTFTNPHSPFQKLVESARVEKRLSYAQLAEKIGDSHKSVHPGTIWIWLHNLNGYPAPRSCRPEHLKRLARVLNVPLPRLQESLDASRHIFTRQENPVPVATINAWAEFVGWLENDKRTKISRTVVLNMARRFMASAQAVRN